ncbi:MAG TPA: hypothetical protein VMC62_11405 [Longilinea sp.]|nr:hypothetical protein [Longilinea sp.]
MLPRKVTSGLPPLDLVMGTKSPFQAFIDETTHLSIDSELKELPSYQMVVAPETPGQKVAGIFEADVNLPGVLVVEKGRLLGVVSRETFYENAGRMFGVEVFLNRPIRTMLEMVGYNPLVLPDSMLITLATQKALERELKSIYQPIIVEQGDKSYRLISPLVLFIAQSRQLLDLHNQRLYTVGAGQKISERDAILRFIRYAGNRPEFNLEMFVKRHAVRCDACMQMVNFSVVDIIRTFPQLNRGIIVEEKMGSRVYRLYVRHSCKNNEIWEIPVQLDDHLAYRSQRPARAVESYV